MESQLQMMLKKKSPHISPVTQKVCFVKLKCSLTLGSFRMCCCIRRSYFVVFCLPVWDKSWLRQTTIQLLEEQKCVYIDEDSDYWALNSVVWKFITLALISRCPRLRSLYLLLSRSSLCHVLIYCSGSHMGLRVIVVFPAEKKTAACSNENTFSSVLPGLFFIKPYKEMSSLLLRLLCFVELTFQGDYQHTKKKKLILFSFLALLTSSRLHGV